MDFVPPIAPDQPVFRNVSGLFPEVFADFSERELFFFGEAPPLGRVRFVLEAPRFDVGLQLEHGEDGATRIQSSISQDTDQAAPYVEKLRDLSDAWAIAWPRAFEALMAYRRELGFHSVASADNSQFSVGPPGSHPDFEQEDWTLGLEMHVPDGYWAIHFNLDGRILDRDAEW